ncbi:MAG: ferric reductase-like transmembrane domain-containing protein, partial [Methanosarcinaceae archaeon]|nr:ferric reductase-like transmembrane domain-containing protein [Methanosarcinaceae archaeon]
ASPTYGQRETWRDLSVALGFVGLSMSGLQFLPTARISFFSDVFDMDNIYKAHHMLSVLSVLLVFLHPVLLLVNNPYTLLLLNPFTAPWRAQAGIIGLAALILIAITSVLRKEIKLNYNAWHGIHDLLALVIAVFAVIHLFKVNFYMSNPIMQYVWIFEVIIWGAVTIYVRIHKPLQIQKRPFVIDQIIEEIPGTWTLSLKPVNHSGLDFNAAQVAWININTSPFTLHRNPFSISGSAHNKTELCFTIKSHGDFTSSIGNLTGGETVYVDGPYGNFSTSDPRTQKGLVLLAGGIGSAPVLSILHTLADEGDQRPLYFFYGNNDDTQIIFLDEINRLQKKLNLKVFHVLEQASTKIKCESGFITRELLDRELPENRKELFFFSCGPLAMIDAMEKHLKAMEIPKNQTTSEKYEMA